MYIHRNYYTICVMSFCNHCKNQISSSALYLKFFVQFSSCRTQKKKNFQNHKITKNHIPVWVYIFDGHWEISTPLITWLTLTGIQSRMGCAFQVWKFHLKIGLCEEKPCLPWADCSWDASFFFPWADFKRWRNFHTWSSAHLEILYLFLSLILDLYYPIWLKFWLHLTPILIWYFVL